MSLIRRSLVIAVFFCASAAIGVSAQSSSLTKSDRASTVSSVPE